MDLSNPRRLSRQDARSTDGTLGISTSTSTASAAASAMRSSSPSPVLSPSSPSIDGLSRRQSWTQNTDDPFQLPPSGHGHGYGHEQGHGLGLGAGSYSSRPPVGHSHSHSLAPPSRTRAMREETDAEAAAGPGPSTSAWRNRRASYGASGDNTGLGLSVGRKPFFHQVDSASTLDSSRSSANITPDRTRRSSVSSNGRGEGEEDENDRSYLAPGMADTSGGSGSTSRHQRTPSQRHRPYDSHGYAPVRSPRALAASVSRSPTFRAVSQTLRDAGSRVASYISPENRGERLVNEDDGDGDLPGGRMKGEGYEMKELTAEPEATSEKGVGDGQGEEVLRGTTLGLFGPRSRIRRGIHGILLWSWTEPIILILIILYTVTIAIQSATTINDPRPGNGYFQGWEDVVILVLYSIFTAEMVARIILTGLLFDPQASTRQWFFGERGVIRRMQRRAGRHRDPLERDTPGPQKTAAWRSANASALNLPPRERKATIIPEAPFQSAVARQRDLAHSNRPYLRHSWHRIDMLAIVCFWISFLLATFQAEATSSRHLYIFRAISVLRAARLLVITSGTATILRSLKRAAPLLVTVGFFFIFASALWSIIGIQSFQGSFRRQCVYTDPNNASNVIELGQTCGGYINASTFRNEPFLTIEGTRYSHGAKGYICPLGQICQAGDENPEGDNESFDNFFYALIQVIIIASINTWAPVMYKAMDSDFFFSALYWIVGVIIINFWLINLVVAVVVNTFKGVRADTRKSAFGADDTSAPVNPAWTNPHKKDKDSRLLRLYRRTELFWVALVVASLVTQATRTSESSTDHVDLIHTMELAFTLAFDVEMIIRMFAYFPDWRAFVSEPRNMFDLFLAVTTSIIQIPAIADDPVYRWLTIFQLARWYRFVLVFPRMRPLLMRLFGSFVGLLNMTVFLIMMIFLSALVAVQLFRGDIEEGELITFSQTYNAYLGMYQLFSSEDWSGVLYNAMEASAPFEQKWIAAILLCAWIVFSFFILLQMFVAVINENFQVAEEEKRKKQVEDFIRRGEPRSAHVSWIDRLNPYRLMTAKHSSVRVRALPETLVLPLKQTIGADIDQAAGNEALTSASYTKEKLRKMLGREPDQSGLRRRKRPESEMMLEDDEPDDDRGLSDLLPTTTAGPAPDAARDAERERRNQQADFIAAHPSFDRSLWIFKQGSPVRRFCQACFSSAYGDRIYGRQAHPLLRLIAKTIIFLTVVASIVVAAMSTPNYRRNWYEANGFVRGSWFELVEAGLSTVFLVEALMKVIADGFIFSPNAYLLSVWNIIDFLILNALVVNVITSLAVIGGLNRATRALRAVRALRLITLFSRLRDTLHVVLFAGFAKLADASVLMVLYLIPFAVWGLNIFSGLLYRCNDGDASGFGDCLGEFEQSPVDDSLGYLTPRVWSNPGIDDSTTAWSFDSFRESMLILFEIVSLEGWVDVMESVMQIVGVDLQPRDFAAQANSIFFLIFHLFGGAIILTLFVSIIIENFSMSSGMALLTTEQRNWVDLSKYIKAQTPSRLPRQKPIEGLRAWCYARATDKYGWWAKSFTVLYYLHILFLAFEDFGDTIMTEIQFDTLFLGLTILYAIDLFVRFIGLGPSSFKANGWNLFDFMVITGCFATTIPALALESAGQRSQVLVQLQKLFLVAIALKLVQRNGSLNQLFKTSVASLPAIGNLFLLWACLFIFYAIMYNEVFGLTKLGNNSEARFQNYYTFRNALVMLAFMSTGEGWNGYMHDYTVIAPRCTSASNFLDSDCGSSAWAYVLFISWNIISMYIFLNMFTGVVVESFAYVYQMPGGASLDRHQMRAFKRVWAEFDNKNTGYLRRKDFVPFFSRLSGVFEIRAYPTEYTVPHLLRSCIPDPVDNAAGRGIVATGVKRAVNVEQLQRIISTIDFKMVRSRRLTYTKIFHEARIAEEPGRGISFTSMLFLLAHYKLIDDEQALLLGDLIVRRARAERINDLVNLDRVRGMLKTVYWRRHFLQHREQQKRTLNAEGDGIPAIVLEPMHSPPEERMDAMEEHGHWNEISGHSFGSNQSSRSNTPPSSPTRLAGHSPALSASGSPAVRRVSDMSMLSTDARRWGDHTADDLESDAGDDGPSMWTDMMLEAVNKEDTRS